MEGEKKEHHHFKHHHHGPKFHHFKRGPLKCQKCGAVWERPKPKCPFCQAELPKPDFKKFHKPPEPKPEAKEESSSSSSSSEDEDDKKEAPPKPEKPKFEKPKCPSCQKELPFFFGKHGHRHGFMGKFGKHGHGKCPEKKEG